MQKFSTRISDSVCKDLKVNKYNLTFVNHDYTLPRKFHHHKKKIGSGLIFCIFASVANILIGKEDEYEKMEKTHKNISDSVCKYLISP